jgi:MerR family mercuric resistance operon transcriptional regulator
MNEIPQTLTIGVLADAAGVNVETIRFYQRKGLMQEPERPLGGIRRYGNADLARVRFIKSAQRLGFSLDEIAVLLQLEDGSHCTEAREQGALQGLVERCCATSGRVKCPLIAALQEA